MTACTHRPVGSSGLRVSAVGLGCNNFGFRTDEATSTSIVRAALELGVNLFDTAAAYGQSEEILGRALGSARDDVVIATKFPSPFEAAPHGGASRHSIVRACEGSLRRLGTDHIDLYQLHRPDPMTPIEETLSALEHLVCSGKVRYIGGSNLAAWELTEAHLLARSQGWHRFVSIQNEYSLVNREAERELLPACSHLGVSLLPYFPLGSGVLTGKYRQSETPPENSRLHDPRAVALIGTRFIGEGPRAVVERLHQVADSAGTSLLRLAIGRLLAEPTVASVIAGATSPEQVRANVAAGHEPLDEDLVGQVDLAAPGPTVSA